MNTHVDSRCLSPAAQEDLRRRVVRAVVEQGRSKAEAARTFGVSRSSVHAWVDKFQRRGARGLNSQRRGRRHGGSRLKGHQAATIVRLIRDRCPDQLKLPFALWTREAVADLIQERCGRRLSLSTVG